MSKTTQKANKKRGKPALLYYSMLQFQPESLALLRENFSVFSLPDPRKDSSALLGRMEVAFAPLGFFFGKEKIDRMPKLTVIASNTTGHPHINFVYAKKRGIKVITLKGENKFLDTITPTAEHTWGLLLAVSRHLVRAQTSVLRGQWNRRPYGAEAMLSRLTLGIVGLGRIGKMVAEYGRAFRMKIIYYDPFVKSRAARRVSSLKALAREADIVTIHVPAEKKTEGLISRSVVKAMKKGTYLINTARAELVDHKALLEALKKGHIGGAALDVFPGEFDIDASKRLSKHSLMSYARTHDNLLITPHIGGSTKDAWRETELFTIQRVLEFLDKKRHG